MATIDQLDLRENSLFASVYVTPNDGRLRNPLYVPLDDPNTTIRVDLEDVLGIEGSELTVAIKATTDPDINPFHSPLRKIIVPTEAESRGGLLGPQNLMRARILASTGGGLKGQEYLDNVGIVALEGDDTMERALNRRGLGTVAWFNNGTLRFPGITRLVVAAGSVQPLTQSRR